jgi:hypothetical protein
VAAELVAGTRPAQRAELVALLNALPWADLGHVEWARVIPARLALRSTPVDTIGIWE